MGREVSICFSAGATIRRPLRHWDGIIVLMSSAAKMPLLEITGLTIAFTGTLALDSVDLSVRAGEIHALLGQNGAGKSTLIRILAGLYSQAAGEIRFQGKLCRPSSERLPINFIHQDLGLVDSMTVAENIAIPGAYRRRSWLIDWAETGKAARAALSAMASDIDPSALVGSLTSAEKSIVAIARALATKCEVLVLDEPTAALPEADTEHLFAALEKLRTRGLAIIYVSHRLDEVFRIADTVSVLRDGRKIATALVSNVTPKELVGMIVGRAVADTEIVEAHRGADPVLVVDAVSAGRAGPVSFSIMPGETVALVGLRGAGHTTIARALFGDGRILSGRLVLQGREISSATPEGSMASGIGFISSKRSEESLATPLSLQDNLFINPTLTGTKFYGWLSITREKICAREILARYSVRPADPERVIATLSGGNQQKIVVARWLEGDVNLLILEEPTAGVDVGSKAEIYALVQKSLSRGMGVLLVSTDFEEVAKISHRALVFDRGRIAAEIQRPQITVARLTAIAAGSEEVGEPVE